MFRNCVFGMNLLYKFPNIERLSDDVSHSNNVFIKMLKVITFKYVPYL